MSASIQKFADYYSGLADEELLNLALEKDELLEAAASALSAEMASRGLGEDALREFRERRLAEGEQPEIEQGQTSIEMAIADELPPDWFDDEDDTNTDSEHIVPPRPKAAVVISLLFWLGGAIGISLGILLIHGGLQDSGRLLLAGGVLEMIFGAFACVAGLGLWQMMRWGRTYALSLCWANVALQGFSIAGLAYVRVRGFAVDPVYVVPHFMQFLATFGLAVYFMGEDAHRIFSRLSQSVQ